MKKKTIKSKLNLNKSIISKFNAAKIKGGTHRGCVGSNNCGATSGTNFCGNTGNDGTNQNCDTTATGSICGTCPTMMGCPMT